MTPLQDTPPKSIAHGGPLSLEALSTEVAAIHSALGILWAPEESLLLVRGEDAGTFLGGLTTNHVKALAEGRLQGNLLCGNKGKILHTLDVARLPGGQFVLLTEPGELSPVAAHLEAYHVREAMEIGQLPLARVDLLGPGAGAALNALLPDPRQTVGSFQGGPLIVFEHPVLAFPRRVALLPPERLAAFSEALVSAVPGARRVGVQALDEARIQAGLPRFGQDYDGDFLPAEAALYDRISFNKGCYVGQEIHARLHWRGKVNRKLMAVRLDANAAANLTPGAALYHADQAVGTLTSLARLNSGGHRAAIALVRLQGLEGVSALTLTPGGEPVAFLHLLATDLGAKPSAAPSAAPASMGASAP
ncbi:MAG: hypothetical protein OEW39_01410 [Deltaproteobacteria bacterium]|nr:hypothetical protein [Deltaproteobacteria bacterium]